VLALASRTVAVVFASRSMPVALSARILGVMGLVSASFLLFILLTSNPFLRLDPVPLDGNDLNPLLQDPAMALHPPMLYIGYVGFSVAFAFAVAAIASMMTLAGRGRRRSEGIRMGLWGGAQAIAFGLGGFLGTVAIDVSRQFLDNPVHAYAIVFSGEAALFLYAAVLGLTVRLATTDNTSDNTADRPAPTFGDVAMAEVLQGR